MRGGPPSTSESGLGLLIRRDVALPGRPGRGRPPAYHVDRRLPWWLLAALAVVGLVAVGLIQAAQPHRLSDTRIAGARTLTGRACIVVAADLSASMTELTPQRRAAIAALLPWLHTNLAPDDVVTLVNFTDRAAVTLPATAAGQLPTVPPAEPALGGDSTSIQPALRLAEQTLQNRNCAATELLAVSDGELADGPDQLSAGLTQARVSRMVILNPHGDIRPDALAAPSLAGIEVKALGRTPDEMSISIARAIAELTGQHLE